MTSQPGLAQIQSGRDPERSHAAVMDVHGRISAPEFINRMMRVVVVRAAGQGADSAVLQHRRMQRLGARLG